MQLVGVMTFPYGEGGSTCADGRGQNVTKLAAPVGSPIPNFLRNPSSADVRRHLPLWEGFWVPKRRMHNRNHPTANFTPRWLFYKCYEFAVVRAVRMSPAEAVQKGAPPKPNKVGLVGRGGVPQGDFLRAQRND